MTETQVDLAIQESDVILFIVDAKAGVSHADATIAKRLRPHSDKKIILVVNKADRELTEIANSEFYALGFKTVFAISAESGRGIETMFSQLLQDFPTESTEATGSEARTTITILGRPNVGKSTLINRILGEERVLVLDRPGTTRDSISIPFEHHQKKYTLIDTAGIRRRTKVTGQVEIFSVIKAMQAMKAADIVIFVMDAREGVTDQDTRLHCFCNPENRSFLRSINGITWMKMRVNILKIRSIVNYPLLNLRDDILFQQSMVPVSENCMMQRMKLNSRSIKIFQHQN